MHIIAIVSMIVAAVVWIVFMIKDDRHKRKENNGLFEDKENEKRVTTRF